MTKKSTPSWSQSQHVLSISETIAEATAFNALLPVYRRKLRGLYCTIATGLNVKGKELYFKCLVDLALEH